MGSSTGWMFFGGSVFRSFRLILLDQVCPTHGPHVAQAMVLRSPV